MKNVLNSPTGATRSATVLPISKTSPLVATLLEQYGCGRVQFSGTDNAFYERHLVFDNVIDKTATDARMRFEAIAHAVRDALSQRWVLTKNSYRRQNPKRIYYLSMEFPIGRSLSNNVTDMLLDPVVKELVNQKNLDWLELVEQEHKYRLRKRGSRTVGGVSPRFDGNNATANNEVWRAL